MGAATSPGGSGSLADGYTRNVAMRIQLAGRVTWLRSPEPDCTTLTALGVEPPVIDVPAFRPQEGRIEEITPAS